MIYFVTKNFHGKLNVLTYYLKFVLSTMNYYVISFIVSNVIMLIFPRILCYFYLLITKSCKM